MNDEKDDAARVRPAGSVASGKMSGSQAEKKDTAKGKAPPAQDRWFDTQLSRMYADLAGDPLPKDMMALLDQLKKAKP